MPKYLLPCACGNQIPVEPTDAGLNVTCSCGATIKVPNTRSIFALPRLTTAEPEDTDASAAKWGLCYQLLTAGLVCVLCSGLALGYLIYTKPVNPVESMARYEIQRMPINVLVGLWQQYQDGFQPLDTQLVDEFELARDENQRLTWVASAVMGGGALLLLLGLLAGSKRR
ncbi:MAG: hypothetical protein SGJ19_13750 [Planctomycetia bacterium]|nr:hypothetical protein [Planctomycetia bacterium]